MVDASTLPSRQHRYPGLPELDERTLYARRETVFLVLAGMFLGTLAMLNILGITRFIKLYEVTLREGTPDAWTLTFAVAVGVLPYPLTFLCTDFISELYGRARANAVVWVGFVLNLWVMAILWFGGVLPGWEVHDAAGAIVPDAAGRVPVFFEVRKLAFGAVAASMIAYLVAQLVDVHVFHFWKRVTKNQKLWLRNNGSTLVSQLVDTTAVILITHFYAHALPVDKGRAIGPQLALFIVTGYAFKAVAALLDTVPFYVGAYRLSRYLRLAPPDHPPHPPAAAAVEAGVG
ncbi:MAG: queuosine precursor transporter [Phycisphaerales bacterium]|jgi:uncharacterized PurR-regulated membrane protein YhhQ (DUF165 family)|nr:queuosine precursor transporter [Phycisphaerales bacterium]